MAGGKLEENDMQGNIAAVGKDVDYWKKGDREKRVESDGKLKYAGTAEIGGAEGMVNGRENGLKQMDKRVVAESEDGTAELGRLVRNAGTIGRLLAAVEKTVAAAVIVAPNVAVDDAVILQNPAVAVLP